VKRDLAQLTRNEYDVLVIGGGIYGACLAWDATLRGLSVALVDKGDFGCATSANSLKIIHGGLRYLQDANLKLVRRMVSERTTWMRIAPHLVHPMPCLMPTYKTLTRNKITLFTALKINDLISYDRNRIADPQKHLPNGQTISKTDWLRLMPEAAANGITGGAMWYDALMHNSERLLLSIILSAAKAGAEVVANYVEVMGFLGDDTGVKGVKAKDVLSGQELEIQANLVVNSAGAWVDSVLGHLNSDFTPKFHLSAALNLVTRQVLPKYAVGISSRHTGRDKEGNQAQRSRMLFIVPWRSYSLIGTIHTSFVGLPQDYQISEDVLQDFIDEINTAYPGAALRRHDILHVHWGFLPMVKPSDQSDRVKLVREGQIYDHEQEDGVKGLITVVGVKYTTARYMAQKALDLAVEKLDREAHPCRTHKTG
jgi:glycerol-3-phosphate dehydrogenase